METTNPYLSYNLHGILNLAAALIAILIGLIILTRDWRSPINRSFFYLTVAGFLWVFGYGMMSLVRNLRDAWPWFVVGYLGVPFISPTVFNFSVQLRKQKLWSPLVGFALGSAAFLIIIVFGPSIYSLKDTPYGRYNFFNHNVAGLTFISVFLIFFFTMAFLASLNFYKGWKEASYRGEKRLYRNILIGFLVAYTGSIDFLATLHLHLYPFGYISLTIFLLIIAHNVVRHQLFEINVFLKKVSLIVLIYGVLLAFLLPLAYPAVTLLGSSSGKTLARLLLLFSLAFGFILSLGPLIYAFLVGRTFWLRGKLSVGFTHELKSPLGTIQSSIEIAKDILENRPTDMNGLKNYLEIIEKNTSRLSNFTQSLLDIAKIQEGNVAVEKKPFSLTELVVSQMPAFDLQAREKGVSMEFNSPEEIRLEADPVKIQQVVSNLLSNAVKFSSSGRIKIDLRKEKNQAVCRIVDEGAGISKKDLPRVFDRFYHGSSSSKGAGLGLSIAKAWVEAHDGHIWAESEGEGKGTTMGFCIPL
ncbi:MAG: hypothetical protein LHV69_11410 [Elusimicrobia bacterium]|nr:hypothetical protein [Candidatus Obscuribacterium magneticum]